MLIGYARISKADGSQSLDLQRDALREAGRSGVEISAMMTRERAGVRHDPQRGAAYVARIG